MRITSLLLAVPLLVLVGCDPADRTTTSTSPSTPAATGTTGAPTVNSATAPGYSADLAPASTDTTGTAGPSAATPPDNTAINQRDRDLEAVKTPIDQDENQRDVNITADIRKQVLAHENMSVNARNVKIITSQGKVTLRGPVETAEEKDVIEGIAKNVAGNDNVDNQIDVKSP